MLLFISCCLWCSENLNRNRRTRRGIKGEVAWMLAWAGPSEAEGPEGGAEARRCPRAGKRSRYFAVHQRGFLGAAAPKRPFRPFWAVPKGPRAGARNLPWQGCAGNTPCPGDEISPPFGKTKRKRGVGSVPLWQWGRIKSFAWRQSPAPARNRSTPDRTDRKRETALPSPSFPFFSAFCA